MNHDEFKDKILKAVGGVPPMEMRSSWAEFIKTKGTELFINYDWLKDQRFLVWIYESPDVDFGDVAQGVTVWIMQHGRIGHGTD